MKIQQVLGKDVLLVDSGEAIARRVKSLLGIEGSVCSENKHTIYSSAPAWEESALNERLEQLGFSAIRPYPLLGV